MSAILSLLLLVPPTQAPKLTVKDLPKAIDGYLAPQIKQEKFSGTVLVAKDGKVVFQKAAGYAHLGHKIPNNIDTKFNVASMGKMITAVAVAQLVERGKLSYDKPIGIYVPDLDNKDMREKVTLHHLLTHTSGVQDIFTDEFFSGPRDRFRDLQDYLPLFVKKPLAFEPGSKTEYSNGAFCLAGYLVEKASGIPYWDYVRKNIFGPAHMTDSGPFEMDVDTPNLAYGYTAMDTEARPFKDGKLRNNLFTHSIKGTPAGGSFSTVGDLLRFSESLKNGKLLSKTGWEKLISPHGSLGPNAPYGYGFGIRETNGEKIVGHSGGFLGISSKMDIYLKSGWTVIVLCNRDNGASETCARLRQMLLDELKPS